MVKNAGCLNDYFHLYCKDFRFAYNHAKEGTKQDVTVFG